MACQTGHPRGQVWDDVQTLNKIEPVTFPRKGFLVNERNNSYAPFCINEGVRFLDRLASSYSCLITMDAKRYCSNA